MSSRMSSALIGQPNPEVSRIAEQICRELQPHLARALEPKGSLPHGIGADDAIPLTLAVAKTALVEAWESLCAEQMSKSHPCAAEVRPNESDPSILSTSSSVPDSMQRVLEAKQIMGKHMVGPDASMYRGLPAITPAELPSNIAEILLSECALSANGSRVFDTHRLVYIPGKLLDTSPCTWGHYQRFISSKVLGVFSGGLPFDWQLNPIPESGMWVLEYALGLPSSRGKTDSKQRQILSNYPNYRTATVAEHVAVISALLVEHQERLFQDTAVRCEERFSEKACWVVDALGWRGITMGITGDAYTSKFLARAVVRKL